MKIFGFMRRNFEKDIAEMSADELIGKFLKKKTKFSKGILLTLFLIVPALLLLGVKSSRTVDDTVTISLADSFVSATSQKRDVITIPTGMVKSNPFVPYRNIDGVDYVSDVPKFDLVAPPEVIEESSDAARVMDTIVSGILYNKFSASAILNIEGSDYLVKKGDTINNYQVLDIQKDYVTVKLGKNTFKAGIGEILTEGEMNKNVISNLDKKFGGEKR